MSGLMAAAGAMVGKDAFKILVEDVYKFVTKQTDRKIRQWNTERKIDSLYRKIAQIRKVKTIWQVDKPVDLVAFYCEPHVIVKKKRTSIEKLTDLKITGNILIEGTAGQGKSIFLRQLCAVELAQGKCIPLFVELRRINKSLNLKDRVFAAFEALGLTVDDNLFNALSASGKILLLLDGFDEVPEDVKSTVLTELEDLSCAREQLRIVVTSRPQESIQASSHFSIIQLDNLKDKEYTNVISRLAHGQVWAENLISHIETRASHIKDLLKTPLMVTLLVLQYKSFQNLPTNLSEFYDALFQTLLQRHDGTKPGFTRHRNCKLDDIQYRSVFEALCILAKKSSQQTFTSKQLYDLTNAALKESDLKSNAADYIDDIVRITCLILREGEEHRFIHKTVQEYYTAFFVKSKPDPWVKKFYALGLETYVLSEWRQELRFLSELDSYRYKKYFLLPAYLEILRISENNLSQPRKTITVNDAKYLLNYVGYLVVETNINGFGIWGIETPVEIPKDFSSLISELKSQFVILDALRDRLITPIQHKKECPKRLQKLFDHTRKHNQNFALLGTFLEVETLKKKIMPLVDTHFNTIFQDAKKLSSSLKELENESLLDGLL